MRKSLFLTSEGISTSIVNTEQLLYLIEEYEISTEKNRELREAIKKDKECIGSIALEDKNIFGECTGEHSIYIPKEKEKEFLEMLVKQKAKIGHNYTLEQLERRDEEIKRLKNRNWWRRLLNK